MARDKNLYQNPAAQEAPKIIGAAQEAFDKLRKGQVMLLQRAVGHLDQTDTVLQWRFFIKQRTVWMCAQ